MTKTIQKLNTFHTLGLKIIKNNLYKIFFIEHYQQYQKACPRFPSFFFYFDFIEFSMTKFIQYSNKDFDDRTQL